MYDFNVYTNFTQILHSLFKYLVFFFSCIQLKYLNKNVYLRACAVDAENVQMHLKNDPLGFCPFFVQRGAIGFNGHRNVALKFIQLGYNYKRPYALLTFKV